MIGIAIFAHNEESTIALCIGSLDAAGLAPEDEVHVLVNGSSDRTLEIVQALGSRDRRIRAHSISVGDKSNAWNVYVHDLADPAAEAHAFVDGDVTVAPGSLTALTLALQAFPNALAASATPRQGRTAAAWKERILREHGLPGNLYALRGETVLRMRRAGMELPVGTIGDDPVLLWLLRRNLRPSNPPNRHLIRPVAEAGFIYRSFPMHTAKGLASLFRRQRRYALRDFQVRLLTQHLARGGRMPSSIGQLYPQASPWTQLNAPFGLLPLRIRKLLFLHTWLSTRGYTASPETAMGDWAC